MEAEHWMFNACLESIDKRIATCKSRLALDKTPSCKRPISREFYNPPPIPFESALKDSLLLSKAPENQSYLLNCIFKRFFEQLAEVEYLIERLENKGQLLDKAHADFKVKLERVKQKEASLTEKSSVFYADDELLLATPQKVSSPNELSVTLERTPTQASLQKLAEGNKLRELNILAAQLEIQLQQDYTAWEKTLQAKEDQLKQEQQVLAEIQQTESLAFIQQTQRELTQREVELLKQTRLVEAKEHYLQQKADEIKALVTQLV